MSLTPPMPQPPALEFEPQWRVLHGIGFGLSQPVMLGTVHVCASQSLDLAALDRSMRVYIPEPLPDESLLRSGGHPLVWRALHWAAAVQRQVNVPVFRSGHAWSATKDGGPVTLHVAVPYAAPQSTADALAWVAQAISRFAAHGELPAPGSDQARQEFEQLLTSLQNFKLQGLNNFHFLKAAQALGIPWRQLVADVFCFGTGLHSRWLESSYTDKTAVIATRIARDKVKTAMVLRQAGLPAPVHARAASTEQAVQIAGQLGYPVVVKPADKDQGLGVAADLRDDASVAAAFHEATRHSGNILVEKHVHGTDYRFTVFNGRVIKTVSRLAGGVLGDGTLSVAQLVGLAKQDEDRSRRARARGHDLLDLDREALVLLGENGMSPASVPLRGQYVCLRRRSNISAGGSPFPVTQPIHPDNLRLAERAAAALQLDLAGVDVIMQDISRSWFETGALICEVNGQPQIGALIAPAIYADILRQLLPGKSSIPLALVVGNPGRIDDLLVQAGQAHGLVVGRASTDGVWQGHERLTNAQSSAFAAGRILMTSQVIEAAIVVMTPGQILRSGLPFDRCEIVLLAGPAPGASWNASEISDMWRMTLPHVTRALVAPAGLSGWLPDAQELLPGSLSVVHCADNAESMARSIADFWPA